MSSQIISEIKTPVAITHASVEKISRHEMLRWVNNTVQGKYSKIEELCSGVAYCQIMEMIFPHSVGLKKIKVNAKLEHEFLHNLRLFQMAFTRINYEKSVPIERLVKGRFQDNFEFLQWFKKFYDVHTAGKENIKVSMPQKQQTHPNTKPMKKVLTQDGSAMTPPKASSTQLHENENGTPKSLQAWKESHSKLAEQTSKLLDERNFYYRKLREVEEVLKEFTDRSAFCERAFSILYEDEGSNRSDRNSETGCVLPEF